MLNWSFNQAGSSLLGFLGLELSACHTGLLPRLNSPVLAAAKKAKLGRAWGATYLHDLASPHSP